MGATHFSGPVYSEGGFVGDVTGGVTGISSITAMTDNSGGTASDTIAAVTAGAAYSQADMVALQDAVASLAAKVNAIIAGAA